MDLMSGGDIRLVFALQPRDTAVQKMRTPLKWPSLHFDSLGRVVFIFLPETAVHLYSDNQKTAICVVTKHIVLLDTYRTFNGVVTSY